MSKIIIDDEDFGKNNSKSEQNENLYQHIADEMNKINNPNLPLQILLDLIAKKGFTDKNKEADVPRFYKYARIGPDVWSSSIMSMNHSPSHDTLLKIVIALKLSEKNARVLMALWGDGFSMIRPRDNLIIACLESENNEPEDIYEIIEYYRKNTRNGEKNYPQLYRP